MKLTVFADAPGGVWLATRGGIQGRRLDNCDGRSHAPARKARSRRLGDPAASGPLPTAQLRLLPVKAQVRRLRGGEARGPALNPNEVWREMRMRRRSRGGRLSAASKTRNAPATPEMFRNGLERVSVSPPRARAQALRRAQRHLPAAGRGRLLPQSRLPRWPHRYGSRWHTIDKRRPKAQIATTLAGTSPSKAMCAGWRFQCSMPRKTAQTGGNQSSTKAANERSTASTRPMTPCRPSESCGEVGRRTPTEALQTNGWGQPRRPNVIARARQGSRREEACNNMETIWKQAARRNMVGLPCEERVLCCAPPFQSARPPPETPPSCRRSLWMGNANVPRNSNPESCVLTVRAPLKACRSPSRHPRGSLSRPQHRWELCIVRRL